MSRSSSGPRSSPPWRPSSGRCSLTSSTPSSTPGSAMPSDRDRDRDRDRDTTESAWTELSTTLVTPAVSADIAAERMTPAGGEALSTGGMTRQIVSVFVENKLAVIGLVIIVFFVLFCWLGPVFYHT